MQTEYMMVNPNDLVIDMPLDASNVAVKVESMRSNGMIQPVTVWLQDMRIIDGFHRTEAAKRLGWTEIPCNVIDCSEDAFWDARIQSAKQHHNIEDDRLVSWMIESWGLTPWASRDFEAQVWEVFCKRDFWIPERRRSITNEQMEMREWIISKAARWGVAEAHIAQKILPAGTIVRVFGGSTSEYLDSYAHKYDLSYPQRLQIGQEVTQVPRARGMGYDFEEVEAWIESEFVPNAANPRPMRQFYLEFKKKKENESRERSAQEYARRVQYEQTANGMAEVEAKRAKARLDAACGKIDNARSAISSIHHVVAQVPEAPAMLAEFAEFVRSFIAEHFPDLDTPEVSPVALENARLRRENEQLRDKVASLERALGSKESAGAMLAGAMAWSSTDIDGN